MTRFRFYSLMAFIGCGIVLWIAYLFSVQVLNLHDFTYKCRLRYQPAKEIIIPYRGAIMDSGGNLLVNSVKYFQIDIDRAYIKDICKRSSKDPEKTFDKIAKIISTHTDISAETVSARLHHKSLSNSIQISRHIREAELSAISEDFRLAGILQPISSFSYMKRHYPRGNLAARLLGMVSEKSKGKNWNLKKNSIYRLVGKCGIEYIYDHYLNGNYGWEQVLYDGNNCRIPDPKLENRPAINGKSVYLTIDADIQEILENKLQSGIDKYEAKNAIGLVMNPQTGEIIAMAGLSHTDKHRSVSAVRALPNLTVSFNFEPGSTLKPVTSLLGLELNIFKPDDVINCRKYVVGKRTIKDAHSFDDLTYKEVIVNSSNPGISRIVEKVGAKPLYDRLVAMGFGHKTGSDFTGESSGILRKLRHWQGFSLHSISFGQEISATGLQLATAYCALANGGKVMQPAILKKVVGENDEVIYQFEPKVLRKISNRKDLETLRDFLTGVVDYGTGRSARMEFIPIAGKTGTAEKQLEGVRGYDKKAYTSVFAGYLPADNPKLVCVIAYDEPDYKYHYASMSAVLSLHNVINQTLILPSCDIIPQPRTQNLMLVKLSDVTGMDPLQAISRLRKKKIA
ncbi:MAG: penicillin-binding protein 2, partial [Candidatus Cloacimonetes bacterium]|nr:penicillin-binding protein 2 [Candidatus Cloacimonadota bacterium]